MHKKYVSQNYMKITGRKSVIQISNRQITYSLGTLSLFLEETLPVLLDFFHGVFESPILSLGSQDTWLY